MSKPLWKYRWDDSPNDQDGFKKTVFLAKYSGKFGLILGLGDVLTSDVKRNNLQKVLRVGTWILPMVGMTTAFTVTQLVSQRVYPSLDPKFAFMFGGVAAAGVMGSALKSGVAAFSGSIVFGGLMFAYQYIREGEELNTGRFAEFFKVIPDKYSYYSYERMQISHWAYNTYDWRFYHKKERGGEVAHIS